MVQLVKVLGQSFGVSTDCGTWKHSSKGFYRFTPVERSGTPNPTPYGKIRLKRASCISNGLLGLCFEDVRILLLKLPWASERTAGACFKDVVKDFTL